MHRLIGFAIFFGVVGFATVVASAVFVRFVDPFWLPWVLASYALMFYDVMEDSLHMRVRPPMTYLESAWRGLFWPLVYWLRIWINVRLFLARRRIGFFADDGGVVRWRGF